MAQNKTPKEKTKTKGLEHWSPYGFVATSEQENARLLGGQKSLFLNCQYAVNL